MNVFEAVRVSVTTLQAAQAYGIKVNRNGMALCPFHNDRNPSMKVDRRYHCFGCQADGDAIDFTAKLFGVSNKDAALKLANDFNIPYDEWKPSGKQKRKQKKPPGARPKSRWQLYKETEQRFIRILLEYHSLLQQWKTDYAPHQEEDEWNPLFEEALKNLAFVEFLLDGMLYGDLDKKVDLMNVYGEKVLGYEERIKGSSAGETC